MKFFAVLQMRSITEEAFSLNTTPQKIADALEKQLSTAFPGETVYIDLTPRDFDRPSNLVELTKIELDALSMGMAAVAIRYQYSWSFSIVCRYNKETNWHKKPIHLFPVCRVAANPLGKIHTNTKQICSSKGHNNPL